MERGSNLNIPDFWKGALPYYAVCKNNQQCIELWVQLGTNVNHHRPRNITQISMAVVMEGVYIFVYFNILYFMYINILFKVVYITNFFV